MQYDRAVESGIEILQWRPPALTRAAILEAQVEGRISEEHHRLLLSDETGTVAACPISEFQPSLMEHLRKLAKRPTAKRGSASVEVFLHCEQTSAEFIGKLREYFRCQDVGVRLTKLKGKPSHVMADQTKSGIASDGILDVYDQHDNDCVRGQLTQIRNILADHSKLSANVPIRRIYVGPGPKEEPVNLDVEGFSELDCPADEPDTSKLDPFVDDVRDSSTVRLGHTEPQRVREKPDVFLSHNSKDKPYVELIYELLVHEGFNVWLDDKELHGGDGWFQKLKYAMHDAKVGLICLGQHGLGQWQTRELESFEVEEVENGKTLVPILLPGITDVPAGPDYVFLKSKNWVAFKDATSPEAEQLNALYSTIRNRKPR